MQFMRGPIKWYVTMFWDVFRWLTVFTLLLQAAVTAIVGIAIPLVIVQMFFHLQSSDASAADNDMRLIISLSVAVGAGEVGLLVMKQKLNWDGRRYLLRQVMKILESSRLPFWKSKSSGALTSSLNDYITSLREFVSAAFTQLPILIVSMGGMIWVLFKSGVWWLGWISVIFLLIVPWVMHKTGKLLRAKVKISTAAEQIEMGCVTSMTANHRMQWFLPFLAEEGWRAGEKAEELRKQTSRVVWRRWSEVQVFKVVLVIIGLIAVLDLRQQGSASVVLIITTLAVNLVLIYQITDTYSNAQSKGEGFTDLLDKAETRAPLPAPVHREVIIRNLRVRYPMTKSDGSITQNVVEIGCDTPIILRPGINCLKAETGQGKSTLLDVLGGSLTIYDGSVRFGGKEGYELRDYEPKGRILHVEQQLEELNTTLALLFRDEAAGQRALRQAAFPEARLEQLINTFSGGERRRAVTASGLYMGATGNYDMLCFDESVNGLDVPHTLALGAGVQEFSQTHPRMIIVLASHDPLIHQISQHLISW